ncbi:hypothetical protein M0805_001993 [Coniferiporia weirii]|nr:hypothetical protein M0805_001993 [Coniferiporia weirii]
MATIAKEINLAKPNEFDGTREYPRRFLSSCETYLRVNKHIYDTNELKINFILSFMQTRTAGNWAINRESLASAYNVDSKGNKLTTIVGYRTWDDFVRDFKTTFITTDDTNEVQQALIKLKQMGTANDFNNQFQSLATCSGITSPEALIALYQAGLTPALLKTIYNRDTMPTTINAWYQAASRSDNIYRRLRAIQGPPPPTQQNSCFRKISNNNPRTNNYNATKVDPPALTSEPNPPTPNDVALQIRQLINSLKDEEKEELFNTMDKQDF